MNTAQTTTKPWSDEDLLFLVGSKEEAEKMFKTAEALRTEFKTPSVLWAYVSSLKDGRTKMHKAAEQQPVKMEAGATLTNEQLCELITTKESAEQLLKNNQALQKEWGLNSGALWQFVNHYRRGHVKISSRAPVTA